MNLWATWCLPCVEEMGLLARWKRSLEKDGIAFDLELWSVDEDEAQLIECLAEDRDARAACAGCAPRRTCLASSSPSAPTALGHPVHALIDGNGNLRCLRVGSVHDEDYGAVKAVFSGT